MTTLLVISANRFFRESLLRLFRRDKGLHAAEAVDLSPLTGQEVSRRKPEVVVLSPEPDDAIFSLSRTIREAAPHAKILMIGMKDDEKVFVKAVQAGATGYLLRDASTAQMLEAVHRLARNSIVCPPHLVGALFRVLAGGCGAESSVSGATTELTTRELQLTALLVQGLANKEIAELLNLSLGTVKTHVHSILQKTQSKNRADLAQAIDPGSKVGHGLN